MHTSLPQYSCHQCACLACVQEELPEDPEGKAAAAPEAKKAFSLTITATAYEAPFTARSIGKKAGWQGGGAGGGGWGGDGAAIRSHNHLGKEMHVT